MTQAYANMAAQYSRRAAEKYIAAEATADVIEKARLIASAKALQSLVDYYAGCHHTETGEQYRGP